MTVKAEVSGGISFNFHPAASNKGEEPWYDDVEKAGFVPDRGTGQVDIGPDGPEDQRKTVLLKDFGDYVEVIVGNKPTVRMSGGRPPKVSFRSSAQRIIVSNRRRPIAAGNATVWVTHPAPKETYDRSRARKS